MTPKESYQINLERASVVILDIFLILAAFFIVGSPNSLIFNQFRKDFKGVVTPMFFATLFMIGVLVSPICSISVIGVGIFKKKLELSLFWRRQLYLACASPFLLYCIPVGFYRIRIGLVSFGIAIYLLVFLLFALVGLAVYRE